MERRHFLSLIIAAPTVTMLAACGSDTDERGATDTLPDVDGTVADTTPIAPVTEPPPVVATTGEPVLSLTYEGGFTTRAYAFQNPPYVLVTNDGRLLTIGAVDEPYPGPLLLGSQDERSISDAGIQALLDAADEAGLLVDVEYEFDTGIADAATTTLIVTAGGVTYRHAAYALEASGPQGIEEAPPLGDASRLADFVGRLRDDIESIVGADTLGPVTTWVPDAYQLIAQPVDSVTDLGPDVSVVDWPSSTGLALADASACVELSAEAVGDVLVAADELTFFAEGDTTYQLFARPAYPGRSCAV